MTRHRLAIAAWAIMLAAAAAHGQGIRTGVSGQQVKTVAVPDGRGGTTSIGLPSGSTIGTGIIKDDIDVDSQEQLANRCGMHLQAAEKALAEGKLPAAYQSLMSAKGQTVTSELAKSWGSIGLGINTAIQPLLDAANQVFARKEYPAAIKAYQQIAFAYPELPAAKEAAGKLKAAQSDPQVQTALREVQAADVFNSVDAILLRNSRPKGSTAVVAAGPAATSPAASAGLRTAPHLSAAGVKGLNDQDMLEVTLTLERIVTAFADTPTGKVCAAWLEELNADAATKARIASLRVARQAQQDLAAAQMYFTSGMFAQAADRFKQVVQRYPNTTYANQASRQLIIAEAKLGK